MDSDSTWTNYYMATVGIAIAGGTANVQRNVIAERGVPAALRTWPIGAREHGFRSLRRAADVLQQTVKQFLDNECPMAKLRQLFDDEVGF